MEWDGTRSDDGAGAGGVALDWVFTVEGGVGVPTFHGRNNEYQQWTIVYNSIRQWIGMRKNRDRGKSKDSQV